MLPDYESSDLGSDQAYNVTLQATEVDDGNPLTRELRGSLAATVAVNRRQRAANHHGERHPQRRRKHDRGRDLQGHRPRGGHRHLVAARASPACSRLAARARSPSRPHRTTKHRPSTPSPCAPPTGSTPLTTSSPWERSTNGTSGWTAIIIGATAATYLPVGDDRANYLRVTASYNDGHSAKTLSATSEVATAATRASNTPPTFPSPLFTGGQTGLSVRENAGARTVVGVAPQATDPESGTLRYSLAVAGFTSDPLFGINPTSRQIRVASGAVLDHEDEDQDRYSHRADPGGARRHARPRGHPVLRGHRQRPFERVGQHHRHHQRLQRERGPDRRQRHCDDRRRPVGQNRRARQRHGSRYGASRAEGLGADAAAQRTRTRRG